MTAPLDTLDARLVRALADTPRAGIMELARRLGVARGTVQSRLEKLQQRGIVRGFGPDIDPTSIGYPVVAFTTLEIAQGRLADVVSHLQQIPEVLEAHATTGPADLHCRIVARTNEDLHRVLGRMLEVQGIDRTSTVIALTEQIPYSAVPLVAAVATD